MTTELETPATGAIKARVEKLFEAFNAHDVEKIAAMHTPDAILKDPTTTHVVRGRADIAERFTALFRAFPDLTFPLDEVVVYLSDEHRAAAAWRMVGTMTGRLEPPGFAPTGKAATVEGVCLYKLEERSATHELLLTQHTIILDTLELLSDIGVMPRREGTAAKLTAGLQRTGVRVTHAMHRH